MFDRSQAESEGHIRDHDRRFREGLFPGAEDAGDCVNSRFDETVENAPGLYCFPP
jgi:hypothetical protein